jgi:hypothetical protein
VPNCSVITSAVGRAAFDQVEVMTTTSDATRQVEVAHRIPRLQLIARLRKDFRTTPCCPITALFPITRLNGFIFNKRFSCDYYTALVTHTRNSYACCASLLCGRFACEADALDLANELDDGPQTFDLNWLSHVVEKISIRTQIFSSGEAARFDRKNWQCHVRVVWIHER